MINVPRDCITSQNVKVNKQAHAYTDYFCIDQTKI